VRLLLDANLSHRTAVSLRARGFDASHVRDHGLQHADDDAIFDFAATDGCVLVSEDTDFGELLATRAAKAPSLVLLRSAEPISPDECVELLADNLPLVATALASGSLVVIARGRMRIRALPFGRGE
jgi:predicted nuclease of predicted toxin-antitoxin system